MGAPAGARRLLGTLLLLGVLLSVPLQSAQAHDPTVGDDEYPLQGGGSYQEEFDWHGTYTPPSTWFQGQFELAAETWWETGNATRGPEFTLDTGLNDNYIEYRPWASAGCGEDYFDACTMYDGNDRLLRMVYNSGTNWCEYPATDANGCMHVGRVALHELGHVSGLARGNNHSTEVETYTVMRLVTPTKASTGWDRSQLMRCDLIELQREYDVSPLSSTYADCVDHLPAVGLRSGKIKTYATLNAPPSVVCPGSSVTLTGTGLIANEPTSLGLIAGNPLSGRTMTILRRPIGGSFTTYGTTTIPSSGTWTKSVGASSGTYEFQASFASGEVALSSDTSVIFSIKWGTPC